MASLATTFGLAASGATAQDQPALYQTQVLAADDVPGSEQDEAPLRFVASETVQALPEPTEDNTSPEPSAPPSAASLRELVQVVDTSGQLSEDVSCLARAVYFEARGEPLAGQLAVAQVVINRAEDHRFPDDYCSVVTQRAQFSFVRGGRIPQPNRQSAAWDRAKAIARIAHRELWQSEAADALYFHARSVRPRWAGRLTARATIDNHIFYR